CRNLRKSYDNFVSRIRVFFQICRTHFFRRKFALRNPASELVLSVVPWLPTCRGAACVQPLHISNGHVVTGCKSSTRHQVATLVTTTFTP
ncbi:unnamed protein product, partial [Ixodes persulcatus]